MYEEDYHHYLDLALECLFRPAREHGFWDDQGGNIIRAQNYSFDDNGNIRWRSDLSNKWRYAPFALLGVMMWRSSSVSDERYDSRITSALNFYVETLKDKKNKIEVPSYGLGTLIAAFSLGYKIFQNFNYKESAVVLYDQVIRDLSFDNSEDMLVLFGMCILQEVTAEDKIEHTIRTVVQRTFEKQDRNGIFIFSNRTTKRHQNQMYTLWALSKAAALGHGKDKIGLIEETLHKTVNDRMMENGAMVWEDFNTARKAVNIVSCRLKKVYPYWKLLYECHQTFFVNAVFFYKKIGNIDFNQYIVRAMNWIYGENMLGKNLVDISTIGVPMRVMTVEGNMVVEGQMFKGSYEIGSYIMALTHLIDSRL